MTRTHRHTRTDLNTQIVHATYHTTDHTQWEGTLHWLHHLSGVPAQHRGNLWRKLKPRTKLQYFTILHHVHSWIIAATVPHSHPRDNPKHQTDSTPFWKLALHLDMLLLHPITATEPKNANIAVQRRFTDFRKGALQTLHQRMSTIPLRTHTSPPHFTTDDDACPSAQFQADIDNYRTAFQLVKSTCPVAPMDETNSRICAALYPKRVRHHDTRPHHRPELPNNPTPPIRNQTIIRALRRLRKGTAHGPYTDHTDTLCEYALHENRQPDNHVTRPYLATFAQILHLVLSNRIPQSIQPLLTACRFIALHKDPSNLAKLRPIGIGTAYRRLAGSYITTLYQQSFATILAPAGQMGVAIPGGLDYLVHTTQAQLDRFIHHPTQTGKPPLRALLLLDIRNMFNSVSRTAAREALQTHDTLNSLLPYFDLMYGEPNQCHYHTPDGTTSHFNQEEGFPQGDPLATVLSCLVLNTLLTQLNSDLAQRARTRIAHRHTGDDGKGSQAASLSYIDDTNIFLPYEDIVFYIQRLLQKGPPLGIHLATDKTHILTLLNDDSIAQHLTHEQRRHLRQALAILTPAAEIRHGVRFLGQPLGSREFVNSFLQQQARMHAQETARLASRLKDGQTIASLFKCCGIPSMAHLLATDVLHNTDSTTALTQEWRSSFTTCLNDTTHWLLNV